MSKDLAGNNLDKIWKGNCSVKKKKKRISFSYYSYGNFECQNGLKNKKIKSTEQSYLLVTLYP